MCGVHRSSLLKVETLQIQKHETQQQKPTKPPKAPQQQTNQQRKNCRVSSLYIMVKHGEKRELWRLATGASNSISRCYLCACGVALCDRPVCGQAWSQALADEGAQAILQNGTMSLWQLPTVSCAGMVPSGASQAQLALEQCCSGLGKQLVLVTIVSRNCESRRSCGLWWAICQW